MMFTEMKKVYSFNSELYKVTGVQKVLMDIHHAVCDTYDAKIVGTIPYARVHQGHRISEKEYVHWKGNPFAFYKSIVFVHERKYLFFFWLLNHFLFQQIKIVYIHHNIFHNNKLLSIMPKTVVSISERSTENLMEYFKVRAENIHKIYNCVVDEHPGSHKACSSDEISILYPARINDQKRQLEIVEHLKGKIDKRIKIVFAGDGPYLEQLKKMVLDDDQFSCLGYRNDVTKLLRQYDYILLFSKNEGLSITLLEAVMCGVPIVTNDVGGNLEIAHDGENAFVANDWEKLVEVINNLVDVDAETYARMSKCSRKLYERNFTFDVFKKKYLDLLGGL